MIEYQSFLNREVQEIKPSGIRRFFDIASEMDNVISLSIGEPDFSTPLSCAAGRHPHTGKGENVVRNGGNQEMKNAMQTFPAPRGQ